MSLTFIYNDGMGELYKKCISEGIVPCVNANIVITIQLKWQIFDQIKRLWAKKCEFNMDFLWIMKALHKSNMQHHDILINYIMLHWKLDRS